MKILSKDEVLEVFRQFEAIEHLVESLEWESLFGEERGSALRHLYEYDYDGSLTQMLNNADRFTRAELAWAINYAMARSDQ